MLCHATNVIKFPTKALPRVPTLKIGGRTYRLSNIPAPFFETEEEDPTRRFSFLWVLEREIATMWRVSDGEEKISDSIHQISQTTLNRLEAQGTLNRVTREEMARIESFMGRRSKLLLTRLTKQYDEDHLSYGEAKKVAMEFFKKNVVPPFKDTIRQWKRGVTPIWLKIQPDTGFSPIRQVVSIVFEHMSKTLFSPEIVEKITEPYDLGMQDPEFIRSEIIFHFAKILFPRR
jgi:hypothetical protein